MYSTAAFANFLQVVFVCIIIFFTDAEREKVTSHTNSKNHKKLKYVLIGVFILGVILTIIILAIIFAA